VFEVFTTAGNIFSQIGGERTMATLFDNLVAGLFEKKPFSDILWRVNDNEKLKVEFVQCAKFLLDDDRTDEAK
jgi:hypothetical protein